MTVRVNKSAFNIREKLSELAVKFGLKGTELARAETVQDARDLISAGRKNLIIMDDLIFGREGHHLVEVQTNILLIVGPNHYLGERQLLVDNHSL